MANDLFSNFDFQVICSYNYQNNNKQRVGSGGKRLRSEIFPSMCQTTKNSFVFSTLKLKDTNE